MDAAPRRTENGTDDRAGWNESGDDREGWKFTVIRLMLERNVFELLERSESEIFTGAVACSI